MVSSTKAGFDLRETSPLPRNTLHSCGVKDHGTTGQRASLKIADISTDYRDWLVLITDLMCDSLSGLHSYEPIEVQRRPPELKIDEHAYSMRQHFPNEAMVEVPKVMNANAGDRKALGQVRSHCFDSLAQPRAKAQQGGRVRRRHPLAGRCHDQHAVPCGQQALAESINKPLVRRNQSRKALNQVVQQPNVMGPGGQQEKANNHPTACDAQPQFEPIVV